MKNYIERISDYDVKYVLLFRPHGKAIVTLDTLKIAGTNALQFYELWHKKIHEHRNGNGKKGSVRKQITNIGLYLSSMSSESNRIGSVVRAFTSHQCGLSSNPGVG